MKLLKGQKIAEKILSSLKKKISQQKNKPTLAIILIGNNSASQLYVKLKQQAAKKIGIKFKLMCFSEKVKEEKIIQKIQEFNADKRISGMIVQLPLPKNLPTQKIINVIDPQKDVDGFSAKNAASLQPVFPQAILEMLISSGVRLSGKKAIIIANSKIFGETMVVALKNKKIKANYFLFKELKNNLASIKNSEIVISAVGYPGFLQGKMLKKGAIVIDGGIMKKGKKVLGDVDSNSVKDKAAFLTPVPGGVGPVTIACLLRNTYLASKNIIRT
jgi:methylenetetrahydrofolate dehydrogenase (NADP+)/methenyltetrahydrofolate cyclohydrolase